MEAILNDLSYFSSLYPRLEGSREEKAAYFYIRDYLDDAGIAYREAELDNLGDDHSFSSSLIVDLPGRLPDTLNIVVPLDHPDDRTPDTDGAINLALGMALIREFAPRDPPIGLRVLFLGAEYSGERREQLGSRNFLVDYFPEAPQVFIYLGMEGIPDEISLHGGGVGVVAPYWLVRRTVDSLEYSGLPYLFRESENQIHRLGMWHSPTRVNPYLQAGYPSLALEGEAAGGALNSSRWFTGVFSFFFDLLERNESGFRTEWDRHYLYFNLFGRPISIGETAYLYLLLGVILIPLGYPFFMSRRFVRYLRTLGRNFWDVPLLLILIFLFLLVGTYSLRGLLIMRGFPTLWRHLPFIAFLVKGGISLVQFFLVFGLLRRLPFSQNSSFYSSSALFLLMTAVITLGLIDISMTYSLLWAFAFSFIFTIIPSRPGKSTTLLISLALVGKVFYDVFSERAMTAIEYLLLSPLWGNLFLALLALPFLLMLIRLDFLVRHPTLMQQKIILRNAGILAGSLTLIGVLYLFGYSPYGAENPQPVTALERIDNESGTRRLSISSPTQIDALLLAGGETDQRLLTDFRSTIIESVSSREPVSVTVERESFLERDRFIVTIDAEEAPRELNLAFSGEGDFLVYDVNFPFTLAADRRSAVVHIGRNPPLPLTVDVVFPAGTARSLQLDARFDGGSPALVLLGAPYAIDHTREYHTEVTLSN